jgi:hypothetical protein
MLRIGLLLAVMVVIVLTSKTRTKQIFTKDGFTELTTDREVVQTYQNGVQSTLIRVKQ